MSRFVFMLLAALTMSCTNQSGTSTLTLEWHPMDSLNAALPDGIRVFAGRRDAKPIRAWYVVIDELHTGIRTRVLQSDDVTDNRETVGSFAQDTSVCVAVNGGYFAMDATPARHGGLLLTNAALRAPATRQVVRNAVTYEVARAAIGFTDNGEVEITWATTRNDSVFSWRRPPPNREGRPARPLDYDEAEAWRVSEALGAGPMLVTDGRVRITAEEEVFFGSSIPSTHPRTAAGRTRDGSLILLVVDGRQPESRGVNLEELAAIMHDLGAVDALNLDGGGSTTLVVNGTLLNKPTGGTSQREVMSALVTTCR